MRLQIACLSIVLTTGLVVSAPSLGQYLGQEGEAARASNQQDNHVAEWFTKYDAIRRQAQMNPQERAKCDAVMSQGLSMFLPGEEKVEAQQFLSKLVQKNQTAANALKQLPYYTETKDLHLGYYKYFKTAAGLFADYLKVQQSLLAKDANGQTIATTIPVRKQNLEQLDMQNKQLDAELRQQYGIPAYHY